MFYLVECVGGLKHTYTHASLPMTCKLSELCRLDWESECIARYQCNLCTGLVLYRFRLMHEYFIKLLQEKFVIHRIFTHYVMSVFHQFHINVTFCLKINSYKRIVETRE